MAGSAGARVRAARVQLGMTLVKLARRSGVTRDTISNIERNVHEPQAGTLARIAKAMNWPVAYFVEGGSPPYEPCACCGGIGYVRRQDGST